MKVTTVSDTTTTLIHRCKMTQQAHLFSTERGTFEKTGSSRQRTSHTKSRGVGLLRTSLKAFAHQLCPAFCLRRKVTECVYEQALWKIKQADGSMLMCACHHHHHHHQLENRHCVKGMVT